jgi:drug/metabolite transporter (DMT)-like permease
MSMQRNTLAHLSVLSANIIFALNFSVVKSVTPDPIGPFGLNVARALVTTFLFWTLWPLEKVSPLPDARDVPRLILCALTGVVLNQLLFIKGLSMTHSTHASLLVLSTPIVITAVAFIFLGEQVTWLRALGLLMGVTGAGLLILEGGRSKEGSDVVTGNILVLLNAIFYSFYFVLVKPLMGRYTPFQIIRWMFTLGSLVIIPAGWREFTQADWSSFTSAQWWGVAFVVLGATFLAYLFNIHGLSRLNASAVGSYIYLQPLIASLVAALFLDESFTPLKFLSALLIFAGVFLVNRRQLPSRQVPAPES